MRNRKDPVLKKLIAGQMALNGVNVLTIDFFMRVYDIIACDDGVDCVQMSKKAIMHPSQAKRHAHRLQEAGFLERCRWRGWRLSENAITDPDLLFLANVDRGMLVLCGAIA